MYLIDDLIGPIALNSSDSADFSLSIHSAITFCGTTALLGIVHRLIHGDLMDSRDGGNEGQYLSPSGTSRDVLKAYPAGASRRKAVQCSQPGKQRAHLLDRWKRPMHVYIRF